jgi:hypothetical protein
MELQLTSYNNATDTVLFGVTGRDGDQASVDPLITAMRRSVALCECSRLLRMVSLT